MTEPGGVPDSVWDQSDRLLGGGMIAVRGVPVPVGDHTFAAVAVTLRVPVGQFQVDDDGTATCTIMLGPGEALGIGRWLREAAQAVEPVGPALFDWPPSDS